ncbi:MAG: biopolymer transporter ExbD [Nitrospinota bacterium]|nr:MAG: biopolymer transporter ExbD [Nitrospinota bacterium]
MRFQRMDEEDYRPELTPLVDVVFQLIIFFMVSTVFIDFTRQIKISPPEAPGGKVQPQITYTIELTADGQLFWQGKQLSLDELKRQLQATTGKRSVLIRADRSLPYGQVVQVMGVCQQAGITDIGVAIK